MVDDASAVVVVAGVVVVDDAVVVDEPVVSDVVAVEDVSVVGDDGGAVEVVAGCVVAVAAVVVLAVVVAVLWVVETTVVVVARDEDVVDAGTALVATGGSPPTSKVAMPTAGLVVEDGRDVVEATLVPLRRALPSKPADDTAGALGALVAVSTRTASGVNATTTITARPNPMAASTP